MDKQPKTLNDLAPSQSGTILSVGNQSGAVKRRLVDMGLTPGTQVTVTKIAPLGDPIEVSLRGYSLSLRKADAAQIIMGQPQRLSLIHISLKPLFNRALQGLYPPGSTFKMITAIAGLEEGIVTPNTTIRDEGRYTWRPTS